jgi:imidazolonepropionase-like amidohydrolase
MNGSENRGLVVFEGARVIIGDGREPLVDAALLVRDGVVDGIVPLNALTVAEEAVRVDLSGKTVMPTLINLHGHIGYMRDGVTDKANYSRENVLDQLRRLLYYGVSVFQSLGTDRDDVELQIRDEQLDGALSEDDLAVLLTAGRGLAAPTPGSVNGGPFFATDVIREASTPGQARSLVAELASKNPNIIKFWVDDRNGTKAKFTPDIYRAVIDEAHAQGLRAVAHIHDLDDAKGVVRAGVDGIAHMVRQAPGPDEELIEALVANDVFACTSMSIERAFQESTGWLDDPALAETVSADAIAAWRAQIESISPGGVERAKASYDVLEAGVRTYVEHGVKVVLSGDTGLLSQAFGYTEHRELESIVRAGVPVLQAIRAATQVPAEVLGLPDRGTLAAGKRADFLVLDGDPLVDIAHTRRIAAVYSGGTAVDRNKLRARWSSKS